MKAPLIILGLLCAGLALGLYQRSSSAGREAAAAETKLIEFTNKVTELDTKVVFERSNASHVQSNLQYAVTQRTGELVNTSNRLVQLNLLYRAAQSDARAGQSEAQSLAAKLAVLEAEHESLQRSLARMAALEKQLTETRTKLAGASSERNALLQETGRLEVEKADLQRKLDDIAFLRTQLAKAEENAAVQRRLAKSGPSASVSSKARLELLDDGTVRPALPSNDDVK